MTFQGRHHTAKTKARIGAANTIIRQPPIERFWAKVDKSGECWLWTGTIAPNGYARFWVDGTNRNAHRWLWEHEKGPIPPSLQIDHLCQTRHCMRTSHMELVSLRENVTRGGNTKKTHCPVGHPYNDVNTYYNTGPNPYRQCRVCKMNRQRVQRALA